MQSKPASSLCYTDGHTQNTPRRRFCNDLLH
ncbi:hypothetical protein S7335_2611 [Synechococcus sp. PCC 7335]|nr:hypothetical protein S7335_2611 [Synechococcus sp. PCC 7335]